MQVRKLPSKFHCARKVSRKQTLHEQIVSQQRFPVRIDPLKLFKKYDLIFQYAQTREGVAYRIRGYKPTCFSHVTSTAIFPSWNKIHHDCTIDSRLHSAAPADPRTAPLRCFKGTLQGTSTRAGVGRGTRATVFS
jgi:hypothetical protein